MTSKTGAKSFLGNGTFGEVYLTAWQGEQAVVKVPRDEGKKRSLLHEAQVMRHLQGAGGAPRLFHCSCDGCLIMSYSGPTTLHRLARQGDLREDQAIKIFIRIAECLREIHGACITHNDLKADNVMVSVVPGTRDAFKVGIIDFGLARFPGGVIKFARKPRSNHYAPEVAEGRPCVAAGDVYSLGVMLEATLDAVHTMRDFSHMHKDLRRLVHDMTRTSASKRPRLDTVISRLHQYLDKKLFRCLLVELSQAVRRAHERRVTARSQDTSVARPAQKTPQEDLRP